MDPKICFNLERSCEIEGLIMFTLIRTLNNRDHHTSSEEFAKHKTPLLCL